jgi:hypothetical protein
MEKNYVIRQQDLIKKVRRGEHRPTRAEKNPKAYSRKPKHRINYMEKTDV